MNEEANAWASAKANAMWLAGLKELWQVPVEKNMLIAMLVLNVFMPGLPLIVIGCKGSTKAKLVGTALGLVSLATFWMIVGLFVAWMVMMPFVLRTFANKDITANM